MIYNWESFANIPLELRARRGALQHIECIHSNAILLPNPLGTRVVEAWRKARVLPDVPGNSGILEQGRKACVERERAEERRGALLLYEERKLTQASRGQCIIFKCSALKGILILKYIALCLVEQARVWAETLFEN